MKQPTNPLQDPGGYSFVFWLHAALGTGAVILLLLCAIDGNIVGTMAAGIAMFAFGRGAIRCSRDYHRARRRSV